jgi:exonuclease SbcD
LHTSDWHLGVEYHGHSRLEEHERFLAWLLTVIDEQSIDVLVVAGDVFDTGNPSAEAQRLYYRFLAQLAAKPGVLAAVVVGGNHDSPTKLDAPREVLGELRARVVGGYSADRDGGGGGDGDPAGELVPVVGASGRVELVVAAVPYLHDYRLGVRGFDASAQEQLASLQEAFQAVYARLAETAKARWPGVPAITTGHLTCLPKAGDKTEPGDVPSDINRVGTLGAMGPSIFDAHFKYVALGHIHRSFAVGSRRVWYSGTPVAVSIDESWDNRRVLVVDVGASEATVTPLTVPAARRLVRFMGSLDEVLTQIAALTWTEAELEPYVVADVLVRQQDFELATRLREAMPTRHGRRATLVDTRVRLERVGEARSPLDEAPTGAAVTPELAFRFAWGVKHGEGAELPEPVAQRFRQLLEESDEAHQR